MGIKVLFIYPNTYGMNMVPPAIALFSALLKRDGHKVEIFDSTYYAIDYGIDSDGSQVDKLSVVPFDMGERGIRLKTTVWEDDLKEQVNNEINRNIELKKEKDSVSASEVFNDVVDGLADTEIEKMKSLGEGIEFEDEDSYREAISTLRENYFPKTRVAEEEVVEVEESPEDELNGPMATYYKAINRFNTQV